MSFSFKQHRDRFFLRVTICFYVNRKWYFESFFGKFGDLAWFDGWLQLPTGCLNNEEYCAGPWPVTFPLKRGLDLNSFSQDPRCRYVVVPPKAEWGEFREAEEAALSPKTIFNEWSPKATKKNKASSCSGGVLVSPAKAKQLKQTFWAIEEECTTLQTISETDLFALFSKQDMNSENLALDLWSQIQLID